MSPKSAFLTDVPVAKLADNKLWSQRSSAMQEVGEVANAILAEDGKLSFAVHGTWGSGKTSFLRMVQDSVEDRCQSQEVVFCWYEASAYQGVGTPETTIALRMWNVLGGEEPSKDRFAGEAYDALVSYMRGILAEERLQMQGEGGVKPYEMLQILARRTGKLADFPRLLQEVLSTGKPDDVPKKLVLIVDDLDRCRSEFIGNVLDVLQRFSSVKNLFILIGVDREVLLTAIRERYRDVMSVHDEHLALEKYIQYAVDLPELTSEALTQYIKDCLASEDGDEDIEKRVLESIRENASYFVRGVRVKTPRAIKRSINAIRPNLKMQLEQTPTFEQEKQQLVIKEQLLAYNWRRFYQQFFQTAQRDLNAEQFFHQLERICLTLYSEEREMTPEEQRDRRAIFDLQLDRMKRREFSEAVKLDIPDELARLLALSPQWFFGRPTYGQLSETEPDVIEQLAATTFGGPDLDEEFVEAYLQSEQADAIHDARASVEAAAQAYDLVRKNRSKFSKDISPRLGNLAVNAENYRAPDLAEAIFRLALEIDEYSGVLQQFASFILDNRPDQYDGAESLLEKLQTGQHASHKPWRTTQLLVQLRTQQGREIEDDLIDRLMEATLEDLTARQLGSSLDSLVRAGRLELSVKALGMSARRFPDRNSRYILQRSVADALARRSKLDSELLAMDLYRQILANPETMDPGDEPHVMHNYATLLYKHDYDDEAGCLWYDAYQRYPTARTDGNIRQAYSMYLLRTERKDLARKVIEGEPIYEMALIQTAKILPERFADLELPNVLNESGESPTFTCLAQSSEALPTSSSS